ncbi:MAG: DUF2157 domain-containing protein [Candidatus Falkowbacteria bacterium]
MSFNKKLVSYLNSWVEKSIITSEQRALMLEDLSHESVTGKLFKIFAVIGALFIGIGIILMISSNWEYLPKIVKLVLILAMPIVSLGGGVYLSQTKPDYIKIGDALIIVGTLLIGASIALLGQLYHLDGSISGLLLWWFILSLPVMLLFRFRVLAAISISLLYGCVFAFITDDRTLMRNEQLVVWTFTLLSLGIIVLSEIIKRIPNFASFSRVLSMFQIVSLKVLFFALFIGTIDDGNFALLGDSGGSLVLQNFLFLGVVFSVMWYANKNYNLVLRHSTFAWLALYMIVQYFALFLDYMETGIFFVIFGVFLLALVYAYIKITKHIDQVRKQAYQDAGQSREQYKNDTNLLEKYGKQNDQ